MYQQDPRKLEYCVNGRDVANHLADSLKQLGCEHNMGMAPSGGMEKLLQDILEDEEA